MGVNVGEKAVSTMAESHPVRTTLNWYARLGHVVQAADLHLSFSGKHSSEYHINQRQILNERRSYSKVQETMS